MNVPACALSEFDDWYDTEHIPERQRIDGFEEVTRWRAVAGDLPRQIVAYETASPDVFAGEGYRALKRAGDTPRTVRLKRAFEDVERYELVLTACAGPATGDIPAGSAVRWSVVVLTTSTHRIGGSRASGLTAASIQPAPARSRCFGPRGDGAVSVGITEYTTRRAAAEAFDIRRQLSTEEGALTRVALCGLVARHPGIPE